MIFRQIVFYSLLMAVLAGAVVTLVQTWQVVPIILSAEVYEGAGEQPVAPFRAEESHVHGTVSGVTAEGEEWAPAEGAERTAFTLLANTLTAMGFSLLVLVAMLATVRLRRDGVEGLNWRHGLAWGAAGYTIFWLAPALGLPPEIPLATTAPLESRQLWWLMAVVCTAGGLAGFAFGKAPWRWVALMLIVIPHLVGAPHHQGPMFGQQPPEAAAALDILAQQFIGASAIANAALWIVLGLVGVWALRRIVLTDTASSERAVTSL